MLQELRRVGGLLPAEGPFLAMCSTAMPEWRLINEGGKSHVESINYSYSAKRILSRCVYSPVDEFKTNRMTA